MLISLICRKNKKISQRRWIDEFHHNFMGRIGNILTSWSSLSPASRSSRATTFSTSTSSTWQNTIDQEGKGQNPRWDVVMSSNQEINDSVIHHVHPKSHGKSVTREKDGFLPQLNLWFPSFVTSTDHLWSHLGKFRLSFHQNQPQAFPNLYH